MSYENESQVTKWLKENTKLSWTRTGSDTPAVKLDRLYTNRSEGYEIRDVILRFLKIIMSGIRMNIIKLYMTALLITKRSSCRNIRLT